MSDRFPLMVPGAKPGPDILEVTAPYDQSPIQTFETAGLDAIDRALDTATRLYRDRDSWLEPFERIKILEKAAAIMNDRAEELALEAAREGGKPLIDSRVEVARAIEGVKLCVAELRTSAGEEIPMDRNLASQGRIALTRHEPIGLVVAFSAFNHPLNLIVHQVGPAVATGCPVIVKPAEATPLSCYRFVEILREAGLPPEWCQALTVADLDVAGALMSDPARRVSSASSASAQVGWMLRSRLAPGSRCAPGARRRGTGDRGLGRRPRRCSPSARQGRAVPCGAGVRLRPASLRPRGRGRRCRVRPRGFGCRHARRRSDGSKRPRSVRSSVRRKSTASGTGWRKRKRRVAGS